MNAHAGEKRWKPGDSRYCVHCKVCETCCASQLQCPARLVASGRYSVQIDGEPADKALGLKIGNLELVEAANARLEPEPEPEPELEPDPEGPVPEPEPAGSPQHQGGSRNEKNETHAQWEDKEEYRAAVAQLTTAAAAAAATAAAATTTTPRRGGGANALERLLSPLPPTVPIPPATPATAKEVLT
eukprot:COSAG06_NODE_12239_length_1405_cov_1.416539_1_plen_185_part_10